MEKVISINLRGHAYQLEEKGYALLNEYLMQARNSLAEDPDKEEVMQDFEQAIAEKCDELLHEHKKTVVASAEIQQIIDAMGPVEATPTDAAAEPLPKQNAIKKLYTLKEGSMIGGVCSGLAAYFHVDVTIVRLIFVVLAFATSGFAILLYIVMMLVIPEAKTPEEKARLRGEQFNAQAVLDRAKQKYSEVSQPERWEKVAQNSTPALTDLGTFIVKVCRVAIFIIALLLAALVAFGSIATFVLTWSLGTGSVIPPEEFRDISLWAINGAIICAYLFVAIPAVMLMYSAFRLGLNKPNAKQTARLWLVGAAAWIVTIAVGLCMAIAHFDEIRKYDNRLEQDPSNQVIETS